MSYHADEEKHKDNKKSDDENNTDVATADINYTELNNT